jgi:hypothetical protein
MSRYQELRMPGCRQVVDDLQERKLSLWRKGRLRLIENVDPLLETIREKRDEGFSVRLLV